MKVFIILSRFPFPLEKGDKLRAYHQIKSLHKKFDIHLCCLTDTKVDESHLEELEKVCTKLYLFKINKAKLYLRLLLGIFSDKPFQVIYFHERGLQKKVSDLIEDIKPDQIFAQLIRTSEYVKNEYSFPKVLDYMDALSKGIQRRIDKAGFFSKIFLKTEYSRLVKYENLIFDYFDKHIIISEADRNFIYHPQKERIQVIPNGVDFNYFQRKTSTKIEYDLLFTGNMAYPPNVNCAQFIVEKIMPIVRLTMPRIKLLIAGANPTTDVLKLASENVIVSGWMEDIRDAYSSAKVFLAPMQIGTGLQNKLLEAMSMNLACITSPLANAGLGAKDQIEILIGKDPKQFAELCILLLQNNAKNEEIAKNGYTFVKSKYNWQISAEKLVGILKENKI